MKPLALLFVALAAFLSSPLRAGEPVSVVHEATELKTSVALTLPGRLKIVLPGKEGADYQWKIIANDPRIIRPNGEPKPVAIAPKDGSPRAWEVTFVVQRPGRSVVRFVWARPDGTELATPDQFREVSVRVQ